ncbi:hypothetical protein, partial [Enterobacter hormaechei]
VVGKMRDLILQLSKSSIYSTKPFLRILNEAQARVDNDSLPLDVRIRSRTTVNDCVIRADKEGWPIEYKQKVWVDAVSGCYL